MTNVCEGEPEDWVEKYKQGQLHLVCVAVGGLTTCDFAASTVGGMQQEQEVWPLTKRVNLEGETGTFWPRLSLTVVPQISWEQRPSPSDLDSFLRQSFMDVAKANREYVKLDDVFLDLNPYGGHYDMKKALPIAREILCSEKTIVNLWIASGQT